MRCFSCGGDFPEMDGPTHPYMLSSAGCWAAYGELLALEYQHRAYATLHRLSVDAYAVQHPGVDTPQARNSVGIHLSRLSLMLEQGWPIDRANDAMQIITTKKFGFPWLPPPASLGVLTVKNVLEARGAVEHGAAVQLWAKSVWQAWSEHHYVVRGWLREMGWDVSDTRAESGRVNLI
jgi:hypothetical protein